MPRGRRQAGWRNCPRKQCCSAGRERKLERMLVPKRRHLVPCLGENAGELLLTGLSNKAGEVVLQEHDTHHILQQLRGRLRLQALLANERANARDVVGVIARRCHDLADAPGVKLPEMLAPAQVTLTTF